MNMSTALNNALGGLGAASRGAAVVSGNIANALTPGYAKRTLELTTNSISGNGVRVVGITRHQDPVLMANLRAATADNAAASAISEFYSQFEALVGTPDDGRSIAVSLGAFENSLITAASNPGSVERLDLAARAAGDLVADLNKASDGLSKMRSDADRTIGTYVETLNTTLKDIAALNAKIPAVENAGGDINGLLDQRQVLIDQVNQLVPVNVVARDNNRVSLFSDGGLILLEGSAAEFAFSVTGETKPHMTVGNGLLSGLELNGRPVRTSGDSAQIRGGALAAQFDIRDVLAIDAHEDLDAVARDLIERFETAGMDPTAMPTDPGLFTDAGARFDATAPAGLASRLELNPIVDPDAGGESWKLRAGLGAVAPNDPGEATQLQAFGAVLTTPRPAPAFGTGTLRASEVSAALLSKAGTAAHTAQSRQSYASNAQLQMEQLVAEQGVDSDTELQRMMQIEQAYAANARIITVVDELMDLLLRM
ncbi:flagellar hook-associated protein FlgK [Ruegeria arenilitoris]|uniref:flagellar hook-associated protein FlgK n=1 Tax=Ruegeria arenilitoris TaxID=1173585 RepID=UPI001479CBCC|nr:flagellar hook-associated protein FlgK [Ruegeria arenilitoris]